MKSRKLPYFGIIFLSAFFITLVLIFIYYNIAGVRDLLVGNKNSVTVTHEETIIPNNTTESPFEDLVVERKDDWVVDPTLNYIDECVSEYQPVMNVEEARRPQGDYKGGYIKELDKENVTVTLDNDFIVNLNLFDIVFLEIKGGPEFDTLAMSKIPIKNNHTISELISVLDIGDYIEVSQDNNGDGLVKFICNAK